MNIRLKVAFPALLVVVILLILGVIDYANTRAMQRTLQQISTQGMEHIALLNQARSELLETNIGANRLIASVATYDEARTKKETEAALVHADNGIQLLKNLGARSDIEPNEKLLISKIQDPLARYRKSIAQALEIAQSDPATGTGMMRAADKIFVELDSQLKSFLDAQKKEAEGMIEKANRDAASATITNIAIFLAAIGIAVAVTLYSARKITEPLLSAIATATSIASGNLANEIGRSGRDETADLMRALAACRTCPAEIAKTRLKGVETGEFC